MSPYYLSAPGVVLVSVGESFGLGGATVPEPAVASSFLSPAAPPADVSGTPSFVTVSAPSLFVSPLSFVGGFVSAPASLFALSALLLGSLFPVLAPSGFGSGVLPGYGAGSFFCFSTRVITISVIGQSSTFITQIRFLLSCVHDCYPGHMIAPSGQRSPSSIDGLTAFLKVYGFPDASRMILPHIN